jgi:heterodisulfide reductase subunit D
MCEEVCQVNIPLIEFWESIRSSIVDHGYAPLPVHKRLKEIAFEKHNPYGELPEARGDWMPEGIEISKNSNLVYFAGCTASYRMKELSRNSVEVFGKLGIEFNYLGGDEWCCGSPFIRTGQLDIVRDLVRHNITSWKNQGAETIVATCSGCFRTIKIDYPRFAKELGLDFNFNILHISEFIDNLIQEGKVKFSRKLNAKATYHDPCHLGRHVKVYDPPRNILRALGVELIEMDQIKDEALCCGAGGGVKSQFKDLAESISEKRVRQALETKADLLTSCCPFCKLNLKDGVKKIKGADMELKDVIELVNECL